MPFFYALLCTGKLSNNKIKKHTNYLFLQLYQFSETWICILLKVSLSRWKTSRESAIKPACPSIDVSERAREREREREHVASDGTSQFQAGGCRGAIERLVDRASLIPQLSEARAKSNPHLLINAAIGASSTTYPTTTRISPTKFGWRAVCNAHWESAGHSIPTATPAGRERRGGWVALPPTVIRNTGGTCNRTGAWTSSWDWDPRSTGSQCRATMPIMPSQPGTEPREPPA